MSQLTAPRIEATGLGKAYQQVTALAGVNLRVGAGTVLAVLGHNGAGKTTLLDILGTRTRPTAGSARVCGFDVVRDGHEVRRRIGVTGQFAAVDDTLSARGNLVLIARLLGASPRQARTRAAELVEVFGLAEAADRLARTFSGGMRRRLDLAAGLVGSPELLFLDEPTTGLDPVSRAGLWDIIERLAAQGTTIVLSTQYLEEADRLASEVVVLAAGRVVASGSPGSLKAGIGSRTVTIALGDERARRYATYALERLALKPVPGEHTHTVTTPVSAPGDIAHVVRTLDGLGIDIEDMTVTEPSLDDVYLALHRSAWGRA